MVGWGAPWCQVSVRPRYPAPISKSCASMTVISGPGSGYRYPAPISKSCASMTVISGPGSGYRGRLSHDSRGPPTPPPQQPAPRAHLFGAVPVLLRFLGFPWIRGSGRRARRPVPCSAPHMRPARKPGRSRPPVLPIWKQLGMRSPFAEKLPMLVSVFRAIIPHPAPLFVGILA